MGPVYLIDDHWRRAYVRVVDNEPFDFARFGPKPADHVSVGMMCPGCGELFAPGDYTTLVPIGPGADVEARKKQRDGRPYSAVAIEVHAACVAGFGVSLTYGGGQ